MLEDIEQAAQREARRMMHMVIGSVKPVPLFRNDDQARRALRIEISREIEGKVMQEVWRDRPFSTSLPAFDRNRLGPMQIVGIDCYVVDRLAAPGWRIINPFYKA